MLMFKPFKKLRLRAGIDIEEATNLLQISKSMIYKIEQGYKNPSDKLKQKMIKIYGCSVQEVFSALNITDKELNISPKKNHKKCS